MKIQHGLCRVGQRIAWGSLLALTVSAGTYGATITGVVRDAAGNGIAGAVVGARPLNSPAASQPLADGELFGAADSAGRYTINVSPSSTYVLRSFVPGMDGSGNPTAGSLPQPAHTVVIPASGNVVQRLSGGRMLPNAEANATSPVGEAAAAVDRTMTTAWSTDPSSTMDQQYLIVDLGHPVFVAQIALWWTVEQAGSYRVQGSSHYDPGSGTGSWVDIYSTTDGARAYSARAYPTARLDVIIPDPTPLYRYLRLKIEGYSGTYSSVGLREFAVTTVPPLTGQVLDAQGHPVSDATVGGFLDQGPFVQTDEQGRYTLPVPLGQQVIGAHKDGMAVSGPRWFNNYSGNAKADFTLFDSGDHTLHGQQPVISPVSASSSGSEAITDGDLTTFWTSSRQEPISSAAPTRFEWTLDEDTISQVEIHWKNPPAGWRLELTNDVTYSNGTIPHPQTCIYYTAGESTPDETGGYLAPGTADRHVIAVKTAPVSGVKKLAIVVTKTRNSDPVSIYEVKTSAPQPTTLADARAALAIMAGLQAAPSDPNAFDRWNAWNYDNVINVTDVVTLIRDTSREVKPLRVLVVNYEPYLESRDGRLLREVTGWHTPRGNTAEHVKDMRYASHDYLRIYLLPQIDTDSYPVFTNGFRYTDASFLEAWSTNTWESGYADYTAIIREYDIARRVGVGDVDEVWLQAVPGFQMWETNMAGPNAYWCNSSPNRGANGNRLFVVTAFNYEREPDVMIHDWGHRIESIVGNKVYGYNGGYWYGMEQEVTTFDKFARFDLKFSGRASAGNCHFPPNGTSGYDYANTNFVSSDADDWLNYPNLTGERRPVNRENWAGPRKSNYDNGTEPDYHRNYMIWWAQRIPHAPGLGPDGKQANWWKYIVDMNAYPESR